MQQSLEQLEYRTAGKGFTDITLDIRAWQQDTGIESGLLTVFIRHTSASLLIQENADPDVLRDLETTFARLAPEDGTYLHGSEGLDDMPAHIRSALTSTSLAIPVAGGALALGTWQGIYLFEHRTRPHTRHVALHLIGE